MRAAIIAFVLGVVCLQQQAALWRLWLLLVSLLLLLAAMAIVWRYWPAARWPRWRQCVGLSACFLLGFVWASLFALWYLSDELPSEWEGQDVTLIGTIDSLPHNFPQGVRFNFLIEQTLPDVALAAQLPAKISLSWYAAPQALSMSKSINAAVVGDVSPGERWQLTVRLERPYGNANPMGFDYEVWLLEQRLRATGTVRPDGVFKNQRLERFVWSISNVVERSRALLRQRIHTALPDHPYAGVLVALVVGDQREVTQSDWKIFNRTGIGHLVSISGLHITMVAGLFASLMFYLWRHSFFTDAQLPLRLPAQKVAAISGALMALLYVVLAGFGVPAQRTLYMLMVVALAMWLGRLTSISAILCLSLGAVVVLDPWAVLWPGFWLSFGAVAILLFATSGRARMPPPASRRDAWYRSWQAASRTQYAVTVGLVPLSLLLFGQISLISPVANAIAIPLISFVVTPLALVGSILPAPLSTWLLQLAHVFVALLADFLHLLSQYPFAVWTVPVPAFWVFIVAMLGTLWLLAPRGWPLRWLGFLCWLPLFFDPPERPKPGDMLVTAFDVGQGMALLIETATHRLLYDTGPYYSPESDGGSRVVLPYLSARGIHQIDTLLVSHNDNDHSGGALSVLTAIQTGKVLSSLKTDSAIVQASPVHQRCEAGQHWRWDEVEFEMLQPGAASYTSDKWKPNARSCTLKISTKTLSILLPGDIEAIQEDELVNSIPAKLSSTVLLAPHHGSGTSSTDAFLQAVHPQVALFQVGYKNRYHHPKPEVFQRYADFGVNRLRTDEAGAITLQFGTTLAISDYRTEHARYWYHH
ncbi:DNA internalization-related competence protein ComEC/Rec2 [soil metagenome]